MELNLAGNGHQVCTNSEIDPLNLQHLAVHYQTHLLVRNYSEQTIYGVGKMLRYFRGYCERLGITQAGQVTRAVVIDYQSHLCQYRKSNRAALTVGTQQHWLIAVSSFFSWLVKQGLILFNPASDLEMPRSEFRLPKSIFSASNVEKIMKVPDLSQPDGVRDRAILETFYSTGIRRQELCNLCLCDVDYERGLLRIEQGKGKKDRYVPIGLRALQWIKKYLFTCRKMLHPSPNEQTLFLNMSGVQMNGNRLGTRVHQIIRSARVGKSGSCHLFRHTFATLMLEKGCDVRYVQEMLGHSNMETTAIYTHVAIKTMKKMHTRFHPAGMSEPE